MKRKNLSVLLTALLIVTGCAKNDSSELSSAPSESETGSSSEETPSNEENSSEINSASSEEPSEPSSSEPESSEQPLSYYQVNEKEWENAFSNGAYKNYRLEDLYYYEEISGYVVYSMVQSFSYYFDNNNIKYEYIFKDQTILNPIVVEAYYNEKQEVEDYESYFASKVEKLTNEYGTPEIDEDGIYYFSGNYYEDITYFELIDNKKMYKYSLDYYGNYSRELEEYDEKMFLDPFSLNENYYDLYSKFTFDEEVKQYKRWAENLNSYVYVGFKDNHLVSIYYEEPQEETSVVDLNNYNEKIYDQYDEVDVILPSI